MEYQVFRIEADNVTGLSELLNREAASGWHLAGTAASMHQHVIVILEREKAA